MIEGLLAGAAGLCLVGAWRLQRRAASFEEEKKMLWALLIGFVCGAVLVGYVALRLLKG